ncbi:hypothetical protein F4808DRAFT_270446 [Astrocystis sublimbata]|nr:hypothetical protein F4808DRAFT_270446 [Astrocystis sublimbata]
MCRHITRVFECGHINVSYWDPEHPNDCPNAQDSLPLYPDGELPRCVGLNRSYVTVESTGLCALCVVALAKYGFICHRCSFRVIPNWPFCECMHWFCSECRILNR